MKAAGLVFGLIAVVGCVLSKSLPIPPYIKPCSRNEPDLGACATERAKQVISRFVNGDRKYTIPVQDPLVVKELSVQDPATGLNFNASDFFGYGLRETIVERIEWDNKNHKGAYHLTVPRFEISFLIEANGRVLSLPVKGNGFGNITTVNTTFKYFFDFDLTKKEDNLTYVHPKKTNFTFEAARSFVTLNGMFDGNKLLGDEMNFFFEENWRDVFTLIKPIIEDVLGDVIHRIQSNFFNKVSYDNAFPDTPV